MLFWKVLQEPRRAKINGKTRWVTSAELIVRRAYTEAEKGSSTLQRLLNELLLNGDAEGSDDDYELRLEPDSGRSESGPVESARQDRILSKIDRNHL